MEDKELFEAAIADETPDVTAVNPDDGAIVVESQPRDDQGRFAPKAAEPEPQPEPQPAPQAQQQGKDEAHVPSWRLREVREEAERRVAETEARWQRQFEMLQRQNQPKQEPAPRPDWFENPQAATQHAVQEAVTPEIAGLRETIQLLARESAESRYTAEKVNEAEQEFLKAFRSGQIDPAEAQKVLNSHNRFAAAVQWHQQRQTLQRVGTDPEAWFGKTLEERLAADPKFAGELLQKLQQSVRQPGNPQVQNKIQLAPSLRHAPAAQGAEDDNDTSDAGMFRHAMR